MSQRGIPVMRFADMTCPIGIPGVKGKDPATIAIAVAAQLLQVQERARVEQQTAGEAAS